MSCSCSDNSFYITLKLDSHEDFISFEFAKATCGQKPNNTGYAEHCKGRTLADILTISFGDAIAALGLDTEEEQFLLHLEWDALRCAIAKYLGIQDDEIDRDRCTIASIENTDEGTEINQIILPPKDLPTL